MARVDPEALEREADELARKAGLIPDPEAPETPATPEAEPGSQLETPPEPPQPAAEDSPRGEDDTPVDDVTELAVLRERYKNAQAAMTRATQRASDAERLVADLRRENAELRANPPQPSAAPASADEADEAVRKALEEYPEIVGPLLKRLEQVEATASSASKAVSTREQEDNTAAHVAAIKAKHGDLDEIASSPEFQGWVSRQSSVWQQIAQAGTASEVIELLDRYKAAVGLTKEPEPQRESAIERARKVAEPDLPRGRKPDPNGDKKMWSRKEIGRMSLEEYEQHRDEIDRAYLEGRVR